MEGQFSLSDQTDNYVQNYVLLCPVYLRPLVRLENTFCRLRRDYLIVGGIMLEED